jgi:flagellin-like protein
LLRCRKAISPLIATIILIAIVVAGGLLAYNVFFGTAGTLTAKGQVAVESMDLVKDAAGDAAFTITIKNTGNKPTTDVRVTLASETPASINPKALEPGKSGSLILSGLAGASYTVGNSYRVVVNATFSDGSTFLTTTAVQCRSG